MSIVGASGGGSCGWGGWRFLLNAVLLLVHGLRRGGVGFGLGVVFDQGVLIIKARVVVKWSKLLGMRVAIYVVGKNGGESR